MLSTFICIIIYNLLIINEKSACIYCSTLIHLNFHYSCIKVNIETVDSLNIYIKNPDLDDIKIISNETNEIINSTITRRII